MYQAVRVALASAQRENLKSESSKKYLPVKIDLKDISPMDTLLLTSGQIAKIEKARALGRRRYKIIRMSSKQIEKNRSYQGGNLHADKKDNHLNTVSSIDDLADGFYLIKRGHWMKIYAVDANGLYLKTAHPFSSHAVFQDGLYLKRGKTFEFTENGPFKNNPILEWIM